MDLNKIRSNKFLIIGIFLFSFLGLNFYLFSKYHVADQELEEFVFKSSLEAHQIRMYTKTQKATDISFEDVIVPEIIDSHFVFKFPPNKYRSFRIYFGRKTENESINDFKLVYKGLDEPLILDDFKKDNFWMKSSINGKYIFSGEPNAFLELKTQRITLLEQIYSQLAILIISLGIPFIILLIKESFKIISSPFSWSGFLVSLFVLSLFLPHPVFNVALILSFAFIIKDFDIKELFQNKLSLLFLLYFTLFICYNLFYTDSFNYGLFETMLPIALLPIYFACAPKQNFLPLFPLSAFILGIVYVSTSLIDVMIHQNIDYMSFYMFTKYMHPVYFSYLLFFSLVYLELTGYEYFSKNIFLPFILFLLLCCGSKLIIVLTLFFYVIKFAKGKFQYLFAFLILSVLAIFIFSPTKKRFQEIFNISHLAILKENPIKSVDDPRLNGLTLRLIMWQESILALNGPKEIVLGKGVAKNSDDVLREQYSNRGLKSAITKYDPHNQFITTYYKMGIPGLLILIGICVYSFYLSLRNKDKILLFTVILFVTAMMAESLLQRVVGIYFFVTLFVLLYRFNYHSKLSS